MSKPRPREVIEDGSITDASDFVAEGARWINHNVVTQVGTVYRIYGDLYSGASSIGDAMSHLSHCLKDIKDRGNLYDTRTEDPGAAIELARAHMVDAQHHAYALNKALQAAQNAIAGVGHKDPTA